MRMALLHTVLQWVTTYEQADGTIGGLVGITADITELKLAEQTVLQQRELLE